MLALRRVALTVAVGAGQIQHAIRDEILARAVAVHDGLDQVFGHVFIIGEKLFGILGQAVAAVAERGVVIVRADTRIQANAVDDILRIEPLDLRVSIKLIEIRNAQRQIGVGEQLHRLRFRIAHKESGDLLFGGALLQ